jgi:hypothetical protein
VVGSDRPEFAASGDDIGGQDALDRQRIFADEVAHAAADHEATQCHRAASSEPGNEVVRGGYGAILSRGATPRGQGNTIFAIDCGRIWVIHYGINHLQTAHSWWKGYE